MMQQRSYRTIVLSPLAVEASSLRLRPEQTACPRRDEGDVVRKLETRIDLCSKKSASSSVFLQRHSERHRWTETGPDTDPLGDAWFMASVEEYTLHVAWARDCLARLRIFPSERFWEAIGNGEMPKRWIFAQCSYRNIVGNLLAGHPSRLT